MKKCKAMLFFLFAMLCFAGPACSKIDGGDEADLEGAIDGLSEKVRLDMALRARDAQTIKYLKKRSPKEQFLGSECRGTLLDGSWGPWNSTPIGTFNVEDLLTCIETMGLTYSHCLTSFINDIYTPDAQAYEAKIMAQMNAKYPAENFKYECRAYLNPGFSEVEVPGADEPLASVSAEEIVIWLLALPEAPAGFAPELWEALGPFICALGASWGCDAANGPILSGTILAPPSGSGSGGDP